MEVVDLPNGFTKVILHWSDRPDRDEAWAERERRSNPEFDREYELRWGAASGTPVFAPQFKRALHERPLERLTGRGVLRGWDFGYVHPACVWSQFDGTGQLGIRHELLGQDETIDHFGARVVELSDEWFPGASFSDYGDPAGHQRNDKSERTSIQVLRQLFGIRVHTRPSEITQGLAYVRFALRPRRPDKTDPGLVIDPKGCPNLAYGFARGYVRDENDPEKPSKDGFYEHLFDALRYKAIHVLPTPRAIRTKPPEPTTPDEIAATRVSSHVDALARKRRRSKPPMTSL